MSQLDASWFLKAQIEDMRDHEQGNYDFNSYIVQGDA